LYKGYEFSLKPPPGRLLSNLGHGSRTGDRSGRLSGTNRSHAAVDLYGVLPYTKGKEVAIMSHAVKSRRRKVGHSKSYRFDARLNEEQKMLIQKAADLEGRSMTDFVLRSAQSAAERTLQDRAMLILSARQTESFIDAVLNPAQPGPTLSAAARRYKKSAVR